MANQNYYEILGIVPAASQAEIETAIEDHYNQWRRLVTHHDQNVVTQANQALQALEQIRKTLTDRQGRAAYDAGIGLGGVVGGLGDPDAVLRQAALRPTPPSPRLAVLEQTSSIQRVDAWICPKCHTANAVGTRFCKQCGYSLGRDCPKCGQLAEAAAQFCAQCGVNIEEASRAKKAQEEEEARARALEEQHQAEIQRQAAEHRALLEPIKKRSESAWSWTKVGYLMLFFITPLAIPSWIIGLVKARQALSMPQVIGGAEYRAKASKASSWALVPLVLIGIAIVILLIASLSSNY